MKAGSSPGPDPRPGLDIEGPLIIVGAGRSGSTLLGRFLDVHPEIQLRGETGFLLPRLWLELWQDRFWLNWPRQVAADVGSSNAPLPPLEEQELTAERARVANLIARLLVELLHVDADREGFWGFKEPWNGSRDFRHEWTAYQTVFPRAKWIHLLRHPFAFARSWANWNRVALTRRQLEERLTDWVGMLDYNRRLKGGGSYTEIRFEDLCETPASTLAPLLASLGLTWLPALDAVSNRRVMASRPMPNAAAGDQGPRLDTEQIEELVTMVPGLAAAMAELGYEPPREWALADHEDEAGIFDLHNPEGEPRGSHRPRYQLETELCHLRRLEPELAAMRADRAWILGRKLYQRPWVGRLLTRLLRLHRLHDRQRGPEGPE